MSLIDWLHSNIKILFVSVCLITVLLINILILPISGLSFTLVSLLTWFTSLCVTFVGLHKLLQRNEPLPTSVFNKYLQYVGISYAAGPKTKIIPKANSESIKRLTLEIDKYFISKWYCSISADEEFSLESKAFIEEVLMRLTNVMFMVNHGSILHGLLNIYLKHIKEFRKSLKRKEKYQVGIEELYRYSHICSNAANKKTKDYFVQQLTSSLLQHFIDSELWNSLPCHVLVSILAKKLVYYLMRLLATPEILNYLILNAMATPKIKDKLKLDQYGRISIVEFFDVIDNKTDKKEEEVEKKGDSKDIDNVDCKAEQLQKKVEEASRQHKIERSTKVEDPVEIKDIVVYRRKTKRKQELGTEKVPKKDDTVKIYEPKNTVRTWRDSRDLACVSLGQDPLDALTGPQEITGGKGGARHGIWESSTKPEDSKHESPPSAAHLFNEVMQMTSMEGFKTSIKPFSDATERTLHNIKDLQEATVNNALHKIGDFQVGTDTGSGKKQIEPLNYLHYLPPNTLLHSSVLSNTQRILRAQPEDEAAGMVEGILDFGRAGFIKGLKLTGLQDNIETARSTLSNNSATAKTVTRSMRDQVKKKLEELTKADSDSQEKGSSVDSADSVWVNPLQIDSPNYDGQILLEKAFSKPDSAEPTSLPRIEDLPIPSISTEDASGTDSPDPEYEDTADLASSIAKLRSLLQQRSSESSLSTPALSPMPDEYKGESENTSDIEVLEVDGVMPSFYKFCTKTASGVFSNTINTIKTALPGSTAESVYTVELWKFIANQQESEILIRMKKLLSERKAYCVLDKEIDTAYDALDSMDVFQQSPVLVSNNIRFEDELDDFEGKIPITKVIIDIFCELLAETDSPLIQEPTIKAILLMLGPTIEQKITTLTDRIMTNLAENLITIPESTNSNVLSMDIDEYIECINSCSPDLFKYLCGREHFKAALKLLVSSIQKNAINEDVLMQGLELVAMKLIEESTQISPPASA